MTEVTVSKNSKSLLARLLAEENIRVEHSSEVVTASFNVETRLLLLPIWKDDSYTPDIYDLFVGHEVAHALYTPNDIELLESSMKRSNHAFRSSQRTQDLYEIYRMDRYHRFSSRACLRSAIYRRR